MSLYFYVTKLNAFRLFDIQVNLDSRLLVTGTCLHVLDSEVDSDVEQKIENILSLATRPRVFKSGFNSDNIQG